MSILLVASLVLVEILINTFEKSLKIEKNRIIFFVSALSLILPFRILTSKLFYSSSRRTNRDILELSEVSLDLNLIDNNVRYKFSDSPVLAVSIAEIGNNVIILVATVSSVHYLKFSHPNQIHKNNDETQAYSIFHEVATNKGTRDSSSLFYVVGHAAMPSKRLYNKIRYPISNYLIVSN